MELEIEKEGGFDGVSFKGLEQLGSTHEDGSLRDGIEIVSNPLTPRELADFAEWYTKFAQRVPLRLSPRCSTHIHVNVQDMTYEQFCSFLWLSVAIEPALMSLCSDLRQNNTYTVPVYKSANLASAWSDILYSLTSGRRESGMAALRNAPKYAAIGGFRLRDYGTLEFRMFDAAPNGEVLMQYAQILESIYMMAIVTTQDELRSKKVRDGVLSILTPVISRLTAGNQNIPALLEKGTEMANDLFRKNLSIDELLAIHRTMFPEEAPFEIRRGEFGAFLLKQEDLAKTLAKLDRNSFEAEYGKSGSGLQRLYYEMCDLDVESDAHVLKCISTYTTIKSVWSL